MAIGRGVTMWKAVVGGLAGTALIAGLAAGLGVEDNKKRQYESSLSDLRNELGTAKKVTQEINVVPPNGKGFIN